MGRLLVGMGIFAVVGCGSVRAPYFIDRIEEGRAVVITDRGEAVSVELDALPSGAREGDWVVDGEIDAQLRAERQASIEGKRRALEGMGAVDDSGALDLARERE